MALSLSRALRTLAYARISPSVAALREGLGGGGPSKQEGTWKTQGRIY